jgi:hypothetical protein
MVLACMQGGRGQLALPVDSYDDSRSNSSQSAPRGAAHPSTATAAQNKMGNRSVGQRSIGPSSVDGSQGSSRRNGHYGFIPPAPAGYMGGGSVGSRGGSSIDGGGEMNSTSGTPPLVTQLHSSDGGEDVKDGIAGAVVSHPAQIGAGRSQLTSAIHNSILSQNRFAGKYMLIDEKVMGAQALVQFAHSASHDFFQYAIKFFNDLDVFDSEAALYAHPQIKQTLPPLTLACDNRDGAVRSPNGFVYPPFLIMERGCTLTECAPFR